MAVLVLLVARRLLASGRSNPCCLLCHCPAAAAAATGAFAL